RVVFRCEEGVVGRIQVDIVEMLEVRRIFELAEGRHAVTLGSLLRRGRSGEARRQRAGTKRQRVATRHIADVGHERVPIFAAFSASHHHTVGKADAPYLGRGSCRLKRSQRALRLLSEVNCGATKKFHKSTRSSALVAATSSGRSLAKIPRSISASTAGFLMPT